MFTQDPDSVFVSALDGIALSASATKPLRHGKNVSFCFFV